MPGLGGPELAECNRLKWIAGRSWIGVMIWPKQQADDLSLLRLLHCLRIIIEPSQVVMHIQ